MSGGPLEGKGDIQRTSQTEKRSRGQIRRKKKCLCKKTGTKGLPGPSKRRGDKYGRRKPFEGRVRPGKRERKVGGSTEKTRGTMAVICFKGGVGIVTRVAHKTRYTGGRRRKGPLMGKVRGEKRKGAREGGGDGRAKSLEGNKRSGHQDNGLK